MADAFWIFAYGSLMWRPGFKPAETRPAWVHGYHRAMCVLSTTYRGTERRPGLVLGLDRGGSCHGLALRVAKAQAARVNAYLARREMRGNVYTPRLLLVRLADGRQVAALAYVVRREHSYYAGDLEPSRMAAMIRSATGERGTARDYLANTVAHIEAMGLGDHRLHRLLALVEAPAPR